MLIKTLNLRKDTSAPWKVTVPIYNDFGLAFRTGNPNDVVRLLDGETEFKPRETKFTRSMTFNDGKLKFTPRNESFLPEHTIFAFYCVQKEAVRMLTIKLLQEGTDTPVDMKLVVNFVDTREANTSVSTMQPMNELKME